jgi:hypothetical protein
MGDEPMARLSEVAREKVFLARGIHCLNNIFRPALICYTYIGLYQGEEIVYDYNYYQMILQVYNFFCTSQKRE